MIQAEMYNMKWAKLEDFVHIDKKIQCESSSVVYSRSLKGLGKVKKTTAEREQIEEHMNTIVECYEYQVFRGSDSIRIQLSLTDQQQEQDYCVNINTGMNSMLNATTILYRMFG